MTTDGLFDAAAIENVARACLRESKAFGQFPTPVDQIVQAADLSIDRGIDLSKVAPGFLSKKFDVLKSALRKTLGATFLSNKVIYLDLSQPPARQNFVTLHETGHNVLVWQRDLRSLFEDDESTIDPEIRENMEREANYFASCTLFQLQRFEEELSMLPLGLKSAMALADKFGSSKHAAIRRYVENNHKRCALLILEKPDVATPAQARVRNYFQSASFTAEFGQVQWPEIVTGEYTFMLDVRFKRRFHEDGNISFPTLNGTSNFRYHFWNSPYATFIFILPPGESIRSKITIVTSMDARK